MKRISLLCVAIMVLAAVDARAQSWTAPRTWSTGEQVTATIMNAHVRDNELILRAGGLSVASQATGDLLCASSASQFARLAGVATGSVLQSGGTSTCPAYSSLLSVTGAGTHVMGGGGTSTSSVLRLNGASGTGIGAFLQLQKNGTTFADFGNRAAIIGSGTSSDAVLFADTGNAIGFMTNGSTSEKWGINSAGDHTFGASQHISDSSGTPTIGSGGGSSPSIAGTDYAFIYTFGTSAGSPSTGVVNFGHTWTTTPVCVGTSRAATSTLVSLNSSTTAITVSTNVDNSSNGVYVLCRSY
jgi:hypothetical protein